MRWEAGELHLVRYTILRKKLGKSSYQPHWTERRVPLPYARLILQFHYEVVHATKHDGHEVVCREGYA